MTANRFSAYPPQLTEWPGDERPGSQSVELPGRLVEPGICEFQPWFAQVPYPLDYQANALGLQPMSTEQAPECRNPQCPGPRDQMLLVDETPSHYVFACKPCKDKHRVLSVQVRTKPTFRRHIQQQILPYRRAVDVRKDRLGRITYFR